MPWAVISNLESIPQHCTVYVGPGSAPRHTYVVIFMPPVHVHSIPQ